MPDMKNLLIGAALLGASLAHAIPVATTLNPGYTLVEYTGSAAVNSGRLDARNTLFYVREKQIGNVQSWYLFFDPAGVQSVQATVDFGAPILEVIGGNAALAAGAAIWGADIDSDGLFDDYATVTAMGLERADTVSWVLGGSTLGLQWNASDPGDHARILVQVVPEPASAALALLGLGAAGLAGSSARARRRRTTAPPACAT